MTRTKRLYRLVLKSHHISAYEMGIYSMAALARINQCSVSAVRKALIRQGVRVRGPREENRRRNRCEQYSYNHTNWKRLRLALELDSQGLSFRQIGKILGVERSTAYRLVQKARRFPHVLRELGV